MQHQVTGFRLSPHQRRLWRYRNEASFRAQCLVLVEGDLKANALRDALHHAVSRHAILRTTFQPIAGMKSSVQVVTDQPLFDWRRVSLSGLPSGEQDERIDELFALEQSNAFDLERGPISRALLIRLSRQKHALILSLPSLCGDDRTLIKLVAEIARLYESLLKDKPLTGEPMQYVTFSEWQNELLAEPEAEEGKEFWRRQGTAQAPPINLGGERKLLGEPLTHQSVSLNLEDDVVAKLRQAAQNRGVSEEEMLIACWAALLWRVSSVKQLTIQWLFDGRKYEELDELLGLLCLYLPVGLKLDRESSLGSVAESLSQWRAEAIGWAEYLIDSDESPAAGARVGFRYQQWPEPIEDGALSWTVSRVYARYEPFKLELCCWRRKEVLGLELLYEEGRYEARDIERLGRLLVRLVESGAAGIDRPVGGHKLATREEREELFERINGRRGRGREVERGGELVAKEMFEREAESNPERMAVVIGRGEVVEGEEGISYGELEERANQLANYLISQGVVGEDVIGICLPRGLEMVIGLLGVMKTGAAYLPVERGYPVSRKRYMIEESGVKLTITNREEGEELGLGEGMVVIGEQEREESRQRPEVKIERDQLCYVIYTSGSTGRPKGVMVTQGGLGNYLKWSGGKYLSGGGAPVHSPVGFDLTITSLILPLVSGETVELVREEEGVEGLGRAMERGGYSLVKVTPSHLRVLEQLLVEEKARKSTKVLVIGGEALRWEEVQYWERNGPEVRVINEYGPTETVVGSTYYEKGGVVRQSGWVPIGKPIGRTEVYIVGEEGELVEEWEAGEIYIGGAGVGRGYIGGGDITAERFVPCEYGGEAGVRVYRTGDIGRVGEGGEIEYLGRNDEQVKVRGYRVELGEVEAALKEEKSVEEGVVVAIEEGGERRLVGYVVMKKGEGREVKEIRKRLREKLPEYMVPSVIVELEKMPLSANGKLDRSALPSPDSSRPELETGYVAPRNALELQLAQIWEDVLEVQPIGILDNFFSLKGHSILAMRVMARIQKLFGKELPISLLFQAATIKQLASALSQRVGFFSKSPLVRIQGGGSARPFFCVHAIGGIVMRYVALAHHLGLDRPFYAFQAPDYDKPPTRIEEIAAEYVEALRCVQPKGPYLLGGWSFGGVVAFEMACQLRESGEEIALLGLFDRPAPVFAIDADLRDYESDDPKTRAKIAIEMAGQFVNDFPASIERLESLDPDEQLNHVISAAKQINLLPEEFTHAQVARLLDGYRARAKALYSYAPKSYSGRITLFRASEIDREDINSELLKLIARDETMGWRQFSSEPVEIIYVPGFHGTMITEPNVQVLARELRACINKTEAEEQKLSGHL
jgi:amino acid adenylation domain-containing protein